MVPSRAYVGILVFALIAAFVTVPYTLIVLTGYRPPSTLPFATDDVELGKQIFLVLASLFSLGLVWGAWRSLLAGARRDAARRRRHEQLKKEAAEYLRRKHERDDRQRPPPGYT